jgi:tetrapyrrole methylase family protein/MazG family protein
MIDTASLEIGGYESALLQRSHFDYRNGFELALQCSTPKHPPDVLPSRYKYFVFVYNRDMNNKSFEHYYETIKTLFAPGGCPWDREQTPESLRGNMTEEAYECIEAINENDAPHVKEELGDVFSVVMMIAYIYESRGAFTVDDVIAGVTEKLIRRHPHVFGDTKVKDSDEVLKNWAVIKRDVEGRKEKESAMDEVSQELPPMERAYKLQKKAAKKGFDWECAEDVMLKIIEELDETKVEMLALNVAAENADWKTLDKTKLETELGDLLFSVINLCRFLKINPEMALMRTNAKFIKRFKFVENKCKENKIEMNAASINKMEDYWEEAKKN